MKWSGAISAGDGWVAFAGASAGNARHAHPALQLTVARCGNASVIGPDEAVFTAPELLVRPGVPHQLLPHADVRILLIEPQSPLATFVFAHATEAPISPVTTTLRRALAHGLETLLAGLPPRPFHPHLARALSVLRPAHDVVTVSRAAQAAGLSPSRLRALAMAELGVSLSDWLVWRKLDRACAALTRGARLADAAARGGFADQAHLTRTMRRVFGVTPGMSKAWRRDSPHA